MEAFGRIAYFLVSRARVVALSLKKAADPRFVVAFSLTYPHIYARLSEAISAAQQTIQNVGSELESWIWGTYESLYQAIRERLGGFPFADQVAGIVAGVALAYPYLMVLVVKHFAVHVASLMLNITLNVLGAMYYVFCRVVIPAIQAAFGGYLFYRMLGPSMRYVAKALDRFMQGNVKGFVGAVAGALAPFAGFFIGPLAMGIVAGQACQYAYVPPLVGGYWLPYFSYHPSIVPAAPVVSSIEPFVYVPGVNQPPNVMYPATSYVYPYIAVDVRQFASQYGVSYVYPYVYVDVYQVLPVVSYVYPYVYVAAYMPIVSVSYVFPFPTVSVTFYTPYGYGVTYVMTPYGSYSYTQGTHPYLSSVIPTVSIPMAQATIHEELDVLGLASGVTVHEELDAFGITGHVVHETFDALGVMGYTVYETLDVLGVMGYTVYETLDVLGVMGYTVYETLDVLGIINAVVVHEGLDALGIGNTFTVYEVVTALKYMY